MAVTKIKVPREKLLARAREIAAADAKAYEAANKSRPPLVVAQQKLRDELIRQLAKRLAELQEAKPTTPLRTIHVSTWSATLRIEAVVEQGNELFDNIRVESLRDMSETHAKAIRMLEMSVDENIVIATDDILARYI